MRSTSVLAVLAVSILSLAVSLPAQAHKWEVHNVRNEVIGTYNGNPGPGWSFGRIYNEQLRGFYYLADDPATAQPSPLRAWQAPLWCSGSSCNGACYTRFSSDTGWPAPQGIFAVGDLLPPWGWQPEDVLLVSDAPNITDMERYGTYRSRFDGETCFRETGAFSELTDDGTAVMAVRFRWVGENSIEALRATPYWVWSVSQEERIRNLERQMRNLQQRMGR